MIEQGSIAIVGMGGIFPGAADIEAYWRNILAKTDTVGDVPKDRWVVDPGKMVSPGYTPDMAYSHKVCLVDDAILDPHACQLDIDIDITGLDPLYTMVLHAGQAAWKQCRTTAIDRERIGVILAAIALPTDASSAVTRHILEPALEERLFKRSREMPGGARYRPGAGSHYLGSRVTGLPAALLAAAFSFGGGSYTLDAACASSIYALKLACDELSSHRADAMLAGGVSRPDCLYTQVGFSQLKALSPSGRCSPFDRRADGLVVGEGVGVLVLKRLKDALAHDDRILGVIRGIGLSNDTRGNLLAPDIGGQLRAMRKAYTSAAWSPRDIDLIECHGAGTPLGDATEITALTKLWGQTGWSKAQCALGSVKSMIGHLLTAAGAASIIKTLLALKHETLPPSSNFNTPPPDSPLRNGPFRVQTQAVPWPARMLDTPLRAAVSAFGFGGVNGHILLEQWTGGSGGSEPYLPLNSRQKILSRRRQRRPCPVAVIGMQTAFGRLEGLKAFKECIFMGDSIIAQKPAHRWKGLDDAVQRYLGDDLPGAYMDTVDIDFQHFHIPPMEIPDILPQHLLMLKTALGAMLDARQPVDADRHRMGTIIGMDFDIEETNFHLRWYLAHAVKHWNRHYGMELDEEALNRWLAALQNQCHPPLTATRTLGALGSMIASRIAREFGFGGPSFTVSAEEASGVKALEIGVRSLQQNETQLMLVGAVDLTGDPRRIIAAHAAAPYSRDGAMHAFEKKACGTLPGEGAVALVLKRYEDALSDKDRIYGVIKGLGMSLDGGIYSRRIDKTTYTRSLNRAVTEADISPDSIDYVETHGSGDPRDDQLEAEALGSFFAMRGYPYVAGTVKANIGHTGSVSGLASVAKTALCVYTGTMPPMVFSSKKPSFILDGKKFRLPSVRDGWTSKDDRRRACVGTISRDGHCAHVIIESAASATLGSTAGETEVNQRHSLLPDLKDARSADQGSGEGETSTLISVPVSGMTISPTLPERSPAGPSYTKADTSGPKESAIADQEHAWPPGSDAPGFDVPGFDIQVIPHQAFSDLFTSVADNAGAVAEAHQSFLNFSESTIKNFMHTFNLQNRLLQHGPLPKPAAVSPSPAPLFSREQCLEFASGSAAGVLGPEFAEADTYKARVRLPEEPLMLVDRILSIEGEKGGLGPGKVVTEHDVLPASWYLDGGHAPVSISVEAGQADLFLCAYLGIDQRVKGERTYRLLDATVTFHRGLPLPGETIQYHIEIGNFVRQGETYLFFFNFKGLIGGIPLITMTDGCAGFFTPEEVSKSGGILPAETRKTTLYGKNEFPPLVPMDVEKYSRRQVETLRHGDLAGCFGKVFKGISLADGLKLPGGRMRLIDRVLQLDPGGGRYGMGMIRAEADIHPEAWFLTCHFKDDMVMPGTLMYECCAHTLRLLVQRMGWIAETPGVFYEPVIGVASRLKCRGPVTPHTRHVVYQVEIKALGSHPEPFAIADAHMFADGRPIVMFTDMSLQMSGITGQEIKDFWALRTAEKSLPKSLFTFKDLVEFSSGNPSKVFGKPYEVFDDKRFIARLPKPPYLFIDRITRVDPEPWVLTPDGWAEAEYEIPQDAWYFAANRMPLMPYCILLEIALQPCGWLAAYMGSALRSEQDLKFRNLGGQAVIHQDVLPDTGKLTTRTRLSRISEAGDMIIESFDFQVLSDRGPVYTGDTYFGFFTAKALEHQAGLTKPKHVPDHLNARNPTLRHRSVVHRFKDHSPLRPSHPAPAFIEGHVSGAGARRMSSFAMPAKALRMIDSIDRYAPAGGVAGLGYIEGTKTVDPREWFFDAHFYQDPVWPGSLGIECLYQLMKYMARDRWGALAETHLCSLITGASHRWTYRGQVIPESGTVRVSAVVTEIKAPPNPGIITDGYLQVDGRYIYKMQAFGLSLIPRK